METDNFGAEDIMWILRYRLPNGHLRCGVPQFQAVGSVAFLVLTRIGILVLLAFHGFRKLCPHAGLCPPAPCGRHPAGQQDVHEHEAPGGCPGGRLRCWLTSFSRDLQINLRINLDGTGLPHLVFAGKSKRG